MRTFIWIVCLEFVLLKMTPCFQVGCLAMTIAFSTMALALDGEADLTFEF